MSNYQLRQLIFPRMLDKPVVIPKRMLWTSSSVKTFRSCPRKFFWKYLARLEPRRKSGSLIIGTAVHEALAEWYANPTKPMNVLCKNAVDKAWEEASVHHDFYSPDDWSKLQSDLSILRGLLLGYAGFYEEDRSNWTIRRDLIEVEFRVDMGDFDYGGKCDLLAKNRQKKRSILVEHKTARKIDSNYVGRLPLDTQIRGYIFGAQYGFEFTPRYVLYDVVRKAQLRKKKDESDYAFAKRVSEDYVNRPDFYFYRDEIKINQEDIDAFELEIRQVHSQYMAIVNGPIDPTDPRAWGPNDQACNEYFTTCPFLELDLGMGNEAMVSFSQRDNIHSELEAE